MKQEVKSVLKKTLNKTWDFERALFYSSILLEFHTCAHVFDNIGFLPQFLPDTVSSQFHILLLPHLYIPVRRKKRGYKEKGYKESPCCDGFRERKDSNNGKALRTSSIS